tara:strand:- start:310 stop:546 length:237 start_codon:yes stop_codon:yes gene_type:complete
VKIPKALDQKLEADGYLLNRGILRNLQFALILEIPLTALPEVPLLGTHCLLRMVLGHVHDVPDLIPRDNLGRYDILFQ